MDGTLSRPFSMTLNRDGLLGRIMELMLPAVFTGLVFAIGYAFITGIGVGSQAQKDIATLRSDMNGRFDQVQSAIGNLPDVRAEMVQVERRLDQGDNRAQAQSTRLEQLQQSTISTRSDLDNLIRASQVPVGRPAR